MANSIQTKSSSYHQLQRIQSRPLLSSMGPLSRLIAHAVENIQDSRLLQVMMDDLTSFARCVATQWRQNKLSAVDISEETELLMHETISTTLPALWKILKQLMFATVVVIRGAMGRVLSDRHLASDAGKFASTYQSRNINWCSCSNHHDSSTAHPSLTLLHLFPAWSKLLLTTHFCLSHSHRHPGSLSIRRNILPSLHPAHYTESHPEPSPRPHTGPLLP